MKVYRGEERLLREKGGLVTIGTFDGVHRGHHAVLGALTKWSKDTGLPSGVITFAQHPRKVLQKRSPDMLTTLNHRLLLFQRAGVDFVWVLDFTMELSRLTAKEFARRYFLDGLSISGLVLGFDSHFGCDRTGTQSPDLKPLSESLGFETRCTDPVLNSKGQPISSTLIREAIWEGRLKDAQAMLGRHVSVYGKVIGGDALGRRLGYRTANLDLEREVRPPFGVYATAAIVEGERFGSVTNVGYRPTVTEALPDGAKPDLMIETHILDFDRDIYGKSVEVSFIEKLRDERRFPDVEALVHQIKQDEAKARGLLQSHGIISPANP